MVLSPSSLDDIPSAGATRTLRLSFGGGATGYTLAGASGGAPPSWVRVPMTATEGSLMIVIEQNTATSARSTTITFTPTGGMGTATPATLTINQLGTSSVAIRVTSVPTDLSRLPAAGGRVTATITLSGGATGWLVMVPRSGFTMSSASSGMGSGTLNLNYTANTTTAVRKDTVVFSTTGGTGTARDTLILEQLAATALSFGVSGGVFTDVRVVNPVSNDLIIYGLSVSVRLSLRDVSGQVVFEGTLPAGVRRTALPPLPRGMYLLTLEGKKGETYSLRLLRE